ncbi:DUF3488 and transglutaminase-like domain-containing protein [Microbacterium sp.]|uniref:transglutaminase TgpA family protein n=1 Tax=Microbacterium sp. TaxID=51671 RepID=UPI003340B04A
MADARTDRDRPPSDDRPPASPLGAALLSVAASAVAIWPYTGVVEAGAWTVTAGMIVVVIAATGLIVRGAVRGRGRQPLSLLFQVLVAIPALTALLASETALLGLIPTKTTIDLVDIRLFQAFHEIVEGVAPIPATLTISTLLGIVFTVVAIFVDQLVSQRLILLTVLLVSVVGVVPMIISFGDANVPWFVLLAVLVLVLMRYGSRHDLRAPRNASPVVAVVAGGAAVAMAVVLAPVLPIAGAIPGSGPAIVVDANLRLGDDLRRPEGVPVLTLVTSSASAPYLRMATMSRFDGDVWRPDRSGLVPLSEGFGSADWGEDIKTVKVDTSIRVVGMSSSRLPVPYAPEKVSGATSGWRAMPDNRTVMSTTQDAAGQDYTVTSTLVQPTREQIRAATAGGAARAEVPKDLPPVIARTAAEVTRGKTSDYDRLIALQDWFRSQFTYSLETPVEDGFDGTGAEAVAKFLEVRSGYCVHFAGAFALMADTLGMPVRIVVGYLPGTATDQKRDGDTVYQIDSDQLHAWPEVHFEGIGWIPFEPTATLGVATDFAADSTGGGNEGTPEAPKPTATATTAPTSAPSATAKDPEAGAGGGGSLRAVDPTPVVLAVAGAVLVLLLPMLVRLAVRRRRIGRAGDGDAVAAWREIESTMIDLGVPVSSADSAREVAAALIADGRVDAGETAPIVTAIERASYARDAGRGPSLAAPLAGVIRSMRASVDSRSRTMALFVPRSLIPRRKG